MKRSRRALAVAVAVVVAASGIFGVGAAPSRAGPAFNERFEGTWVGSGTVMRDSDPQPRRVTCTIDGAAEADRLALQGTCRAMLIFTRSIGADLAVDASGRYRGVYTGSRVGPAQLSGRVVGDSAVLAVRFPEGVGGGRQEMTITHPPGADAFTLRVTDLVDGAPREITNLTFRRR